MTHWELTPHLAAKYPWLRVDSSTIDEFRAPFDWGRSSSSSSCSSASSANANDAPDARKEGHEPKRGLSGRRRRGDAISKLKKKRLVTAGRHGKHNGRPAGGGCGRRRQRVETPTSASHNQDVPNKEECVAERSKTLKLPPASRDTASPPCLQEPIQPRASDPDGLAKESPAWLAVKADFEAATKPRRARKQHKMRKTRLQALSLQ